MTLRIHTSKTQSGPPLLTVRSQKPFNAETPVSLIPDNYITPTALTYIRHHHPVPTDLQSSDYRLVIAFEDANIVQLSLSDLETKFPVHTITNTMQCAGNRRREFLQFDRVQGLEWGSGAVSTSTWTGVYLRDVLEYAGLGDHSALVERAGVEHICFEARDEPYDGSIPLSKALDDRGDVLIAFEMNGEPVPREHGGPVRVIVPGHVAARSVKWVKRITASKEEAKSNWQRGLAYKLIGGGVKDFSNIDPMDYESVQELPVQSTICNPVPGTVVEREEETVSVNGYAWSGEYIYYC